ncbi:MAG TPA: zinc-binding dehydrogenase [Thermoanaerobaculia bacterium]
MRAATLSAPRTVEVRQVSLPEIHSDQVLVRLRGCGICASNGPVFEGREWFHYPLPPGQPGHEGWGEIAELGSGVEGLEAGQPVALLSDRAFAEYDVAAADAVVPLPAALAGRPFPGEPLACVMNVLRRSDIQPGQTVAVIGAGFLGTLLTGLAARLGARVLAVSRRPFALEASRRQGAERTFSLEDPGAVVREVMALTGGEGCERVIECAGKQGPLDLAGELIRVRGRLVIAGYHQDGPRQVNLQQWNWRGIDVINAHERDPRVYARGLREAVAAVAEGRLDPFPLLTHGFPLERLGDALEINEARPDGFMKSWVEM